MKWTSETGANLQTGAAGAARGCGARQPVPDTGSTPECLLHRAIFIFSAANHAANHAINKASGFIDWQRHRVGDDGHVVFAVIRAAHLPFLCGIGGNNGEAAE